MKEINGFAFEETGYPWPKTEEDVMSDKIWRDLYDIALEHSKDNPEVAARWFKENFGAADGFTEWLMEFQPLLFDLWATGYFDE